MTNNCNKIRFVALVMVMLLGTIHVWAYNISFNANGGDACPMRTTDANDEVELPSSSKNGMHLVGWFYGNTFYGYAGQKVKITRNITLTAEWANVESSNQTIGTDSKVVDVNNVFSKSYEIKNGEQREFTFRNRRHTGSTEQRWYNWVMWASNSYRTDWGNRKDYFYLNTEPCVRKHITENDNFWDNHEATTVYIKDDNGELVSLETDEQWEQFLSDMGNANVNVKVANYDGKIRVYSVMTANNRTYVYPYEYEKYAINNSVDGAVWVYFSVDHTYITNFTAKDPVGLAKVACNLDYTTSYGPRNCSFSITTPEGLELSVGTVVGKGDKVVYTISLGHKWKLTKWGAAYNNPVNPRTVTVQDSHVSSGWVAPYVTLEYTGVNVETDRVFHLDFEEMSDNDLIRVVELPEGNGTNAPEGEPNSNEQGLFYLYGDKGRIMSDPVFGKYYQNLAVNPTEYTESKSENFLRYVLTDDEKYLLGSKINEAPEGQRAATIGFWVNGSLAVDYELPLERGSMFCMFSNERFKKADNIVERPRFMFDISCNGWIYSYMPNSYYLKDENDNFVYENGQQVKKEYVNQFFYGETVNVVEGRKPKPSLFGENNYAHAQDQRRHKFYDDRRWHYVTYVATEDLKKITMYLDGEKTGELDTRSLGDMQLFEEGGDYPGRVWYLRNIVLGGFTPHGLFFEKQYYSDAALAYDDISIYSRALSQSEIVDIIDSKAVNRKEWHFTEALKADGMSEKKLDVLDGFRWRKGSSDGIYVLNAQLNKSELEVGNNNTIFSTEGLKFTGAKGQIIIDQKNGLIGLKRGAEIYVPGLNKGENVYFVVKSGDPEKYPLDPYDLWPINDPCQLFTRGVSLYGIQGKEDFSVFTGYKNNNVSSQSYGFRVYSHGTIPAYNTAYTGYPHNNNNNENVLWISDVFISPYSLTYTDDNRKVNSINTKNYTRRVIHVDVERNDDVHEFKQPTLPQLIFTNGTSTKVDITKYTKADFDNGTNPCYIRFSSSAPHIANVNQSGKVTVTGITGYATIKAELVFDNLYDGCISTAYQIRVENTPKTHHVEENGKYDVAEKETVKAKDGSDAITMSLGGWAYTANAYKGTVGDVMDNNGSATDSWTKGFVHNERNDVTPIDGFNTYSQGGQNAKSESYGNDDGRYIPTTQVVRNVTPWTLPCRGSYLKFDAEKPGVLTVYVLQNGNLDKSDMTNDYSDQIHWRPVYITNERGVCVPRVQYDTNSKISENDNFFKEGRRRAQFIEEEEGTYNQRLKNALLGLKNSNYDRFKLLLSRWENQGWKQKVIETGDGGYMIMSKGIVRYSFNVVPGQTYYVFSNDTKIGYAGYNFEEGKILFDNASDSYDTNPMYSASVTTTPVVYKDELNYTPALPKDVFCMPVIYERNFKAGTWSSICLPFSINRKQLEENFGEGTSVVLLKQVINQGYKKGRVELIWHVNQDIIAGYPYFILPTKDVTEIRVNASSCTSQAWYLTKPDLAVGSNGQSFAHKSGYTYYDDYPYVFEGNFVDEVIPAGSYVMSNSGTLARVKNSVKAKPFRAYIRCVDAANAKPLTTMSFSESEGETTSIEELLQDNGIILESSDVYGVNGVKVRSNTHSLEGLSKGIYVVNGKKYVVK